MLSYDLKVGEAVQIGDVACIAFDQKSGNRIKIRIATAIRPILVIATGIIPRQFTMGVTGDRHVASASGPPPDRQGSAAGPPARLQAVG